ncbi:MAG: hypothetical protein GXO17_06345 [Thermodesulfobacteria bacterium]|nr:hypothetical protein [Thermodesulfobacteriota bacterium]
MRQALLLIVLILVSCAPRVPVSYQPPKGSPPPALKGTARFEVHYPGGEQEGRLFYFITREGIYTEALSPFGWSIFQTLFRGNTATLVVVPKQEVLIFFLRTPPPEWTNNWGLLALGAIPDEWKVEEAFRVRDEVEVHFRFEDGFRARAVFSPEGILRELVLARQRELARFRYEWEADHLREISLKIPQLRTRVRFTFLTRKVAAPQPLTITIPANFTTKAYDLHL